MKMPPQPWFKLGACYLSASITEHIFDDFMDLRQLLDAHRFVSWAFGNDEAIANVRMALDEQRPIISNHLAACIKVIIATSGTGSHTLVLADNELLDLDFSELFNLYQEIQKCRT